MKFSLQSKTLAPEHCDPLYIFAKLSSDGKYAALLESADRAHGTNDFSFVAIGCRDHLTVENGTVKGSKYIKDGSVDDPLVPFEIIIDNTPSNDPLFSMGYIGFLSFESMRFFEKIDLEPHPTVPDASFYLPEVIVRIDHEKHTVTIIYHSDTTEDIDYISTTILASPFYDDDKEKASSINSILPTLEDIEPFRTVSPDTHKERIQRIKEEILDGEAFQVVLSQELQIECRHNPLDIYEQLRALNPSPYMYYFQTPERTIVGASPETLVRVQNSTVTYRPIAGTRKRTGNIQKDTKMSEELLCDPKERAEHQMLVDLGRNDVGKIAEVGTVRVSNPFHIERYSHVFHIVTDIHATLKSTLSPLDALRATFPAGTLTGAPKLRAIEILSAEEQNPRGIYGGAFGYIDLNGNIDFAIIIRTMLIQNNIISLRAGGGIVKDSDPDLEDKECLHKASSCLAAIFQTTPSISNE